MQWAVAFGVNDEFLHHPVGNELIHLVVDEEQLVHGRYRIFSQLPERLLALGAGLWRRCSSHWDLGVAGGRVRRLYDP